MGFAIFFASKNQHFMIFMQFDVFNGKIYIYIYGCKSKYKAPIHTLNPQADPYPRSIPKRRWSRPIHTSGSPRADPYPNFDATPYIYIYIYYIAGVFVPVNGGNMALVDQIAAQADIPCDSRAFGRKSTCCNAEEKQPENWANLNWMEHEWTWWWQKLHDFAGNHTKSQVEIKKMRWCLFYMFPLYPIDFSYMS